MTIRSGSTFDVSPPDMPLSEKFDVQVKAYLPSYVAVFAADIALSITNTLPG
jgi:hypothetical protein